MMITSPMCQPLLCKPLIKKFQRVQLCRKSVYAQQVETKNSENTNQQQLQSQIVEKQEEQKPGLLDSRYFVEDETVAFWRGFRFSSSQDGPNMDSLEGINKLREVLFQAFFSARIFQDETSIRYWSYHIARTTFFVALGATSLFVNSAINSNTTITNPKQPRFGTSEFTASMFLNLLFFGPPAEAMTAFHQDFKNIQQGLYKLPWDMTTPQHHQYNPLFVAQNFALYLQDAVQVLTRSRNSDQKSLWLQNSNIYPDYYQNTFHYQTDGWMSSFSAKIYETQTEVIFSGKQDAMQRHTLIPIHNYLKNKSGVGSGLRGGGMRALEVAAGTGRFATFFKDNFSDVHLTISDLSPFYLEQARKNIDEWKNLCGSQDEAGVDFIQAAAENLPFEDNSFEIVYCLYLFHEIPQNVRVQAIKEFSRVLCPGGILVVTDSYQLGDRLEFDHRMQFFQNFNEPWYGSYTKTNFGAIFEEANLLCDYKFVCSYSKTLSALKPCD